MCGRIQVIAHLLNQQVSDAFGIDFMLETNLDLRPTDAMATVTAKPGSPRQLNSRWGIKPQWSNKLIINAQAETVASKKTFKNAFAQHRCLVPCSGWYEWKEEGGAKKQRYNFSHAEDKPLYMAAIYFEAVKTETAHSETLQSEMAELPQLVTLTTEANSQCVNYHQRMPLLISPEHTHSWLYDDYSELGHLLKTEDNVLLKVERYVI